MAADASTIRIPQHRGAEEGVQPILINNPSTVVDESDCSESVAPQGNRIF